MGKEIIKEFELDNNNMTVEELEVLCKLMGRMAYQYYGCEVREKMTEFDKEQAFNIAITLNSILDELQDEGYTSKDIIK